MWRKPPASVGVVIELQTTAAVNLHKPRMNLRVLRAANTKVHCHLLKILLHVPLCTMKKEGRKEGRRSSTCVERPWDTTRGCFPNVSLVTSNPKSSWQARSSSAGHVQALDCKHLTHLQYSAQWRELHAALLHQRMTRTISGLQIYVYINMFSNSFDLYKQPSVVSKILAVVVLRLYFPPQFNYLWTPFPGSNEF